jgi:hypothetical protein
MGCESGISEETFGTVSETSVSIAELMGCDSENITTLQLFHGGTLLVAQLVDALRYKSEGRGFDSRWCH